MDIRALMDSARSRGLTFHIEGDRIKVEAPVEPDNETKALLDRLRGHRDELRRVLLAPPCWNCGATMSPTHEQHLCLLELCQVGVTKGLAVSEQNNSLAEALAAILKPIVKEAVQEAMNLNPRGTMQVGIADKSFLTVKQAAETSGLGSSTIRLLIRKRQLRAQKVGRRVLIKRSDLESFLEANPIRSERQ